MGIISTLTDIWAGVEDPFLLCGDTALRFQDILDQQPVDLSAVKPGDVVALIGDFTPDAILTLLRVIDLGAVVMPLTVETRSQHEYFFEQGLVDVAIEGASVTRRPHDDSHPLLQQLRDQNHAGLILYSTGTTGRPKAILHDLTLFLQRYGTPRPSLRTLNFLLFDHIGGINTLLHTLYNRGVVIAPEARTVDSILHTCAQHDVEVLPTTPTFLRMMLMSGRLPEDVPNTLKIITYGTERMDQPTLDALCAALPEVDFRQTFGMSELGIVRVKSEARDSLFMRVGGEGVETRVVDGVLEIKSKTRMLGYLNAPSPFDAEGWYNTGDVVEEKDGLYKVVGRTNDVINVGGLKFMAADVERVALQHPGVAMVKVTAKTNPITGQHVEITVEPSGRDGFDLGAFKQHMQTHLQAHMQPKRYRVDSITYGHRFKKA